MKYRTTVSYRETMKKKRRRNCRKRKDCNKMRYKAKPEVKKMILEKKMKTREIEMYDSVLKNYKMETNQGSSYTCACFLRLLFQNQVQKFQNKSGSSYNFKI